jgi:hypothetical protein
MYIQQITLCSCHCYKPDKNTANVHSTTHTLLQSLLQNWYTNRYCIFNNSHTTLVIATELVNKQLIYIQQLPHCSSHCYRTGSQRATVYSTTPTLLLSLLQNWYTNSYCSFNNTNTALVNATELVHKKLLYIQQIPHCSSHCYRTGTQTATVHSTTQTLL